LSDFQDIFFFWSFLDALPGDILNKLFLIFGRGLPLGSRNKIPGEALVKMLTNLVKPGRAKGLGATKSSFIRQRPSGLITNIPSKGLPCENL